MTSQRVALTAVKTVHTLIWLLVESSVVYLLVAGLRGRSDRRAAFAAAVVAAETAVFLGNGARCPLTGVAESLGAESGGVTDIFLPKWFAHYLPVIHVPVLGLTIYLHARNLRTGGSPSERHA
jgi:hypothetical protein